MVSQFPYHTLNFHSFQVYISEMSETVKFYDIVVRYTHSIQKEYTTTNHALCIHECAARRLDKDHEC